MSSWIVVGLGNPGPRYEKTRHNAGFLYLDRLASRLGTGFVPGPEGPWLEAPFSSGVLVKPLTWMNSSGEIFQAERFRPREGFRVLVAVDTMDLPLGALRLKKKGGTAGHNGLKSLCAAIGHVFFPLYLGIGRPAEGQTVIDHVLGEFGPDEKVFDQALDFAVDSFPALLEKDLEYSMNLLNSFKPDTVVT